VSWQKPWTEEAFRSPLQASRPLVRRPRAGRSFVRPSRRGARCVYLCTMRKGRVASSEADEARSEGDGTQRMVGRLCASSRRFEAESGANGAVCGVASSSESSSSAMSGTTHGLDSSMNGALLGVLGTPSNQPSSSSSGGHVSIVKCSLLRAKTRPSRVGSFRSATARASIETSSKKMGWNIVREVAST